MVRLNRITTGGGDAGETSLGDGSRVPKTHPRIVACGSVDELNCVLGLALTNEQLPEEFCGWLRRVQNDLFDIGADLCVPESPGDSPRGAASSLRATPQQVARLQSWIEALAARLPEADSFILPGGSSASAWLHLARSVARRAEIDVLRLHEVEPVGAPLRVYLNRLSDLLFVLARACNNNGADDVLWVPGGDS